MRKIIVIAVFLLIVLSGFVYALSLKLNTPLTKEELKERMSTDSNFYLSMGNYLYNGGYKESAYKIYQIGLTIDPNNANLLNSIGMYYESEGERKLAEEYFLKALNKDENNLFARNNLAIIYHDDKKYNEAIEQLKALIELNNDNPSYHYDLAINLADNFRNNNIGNLDDAISEFERAESLSPDYMNAKENIEVLTKIKNLMGSNQ